MTANAHVLVPDAASGPFFAGAAAGRLMLLRCAACGRFQSPTAYLGVPVRPRCVCCFAAPLDWAASSGRATLYSFVVVHREPELPYNLSVVETDEGVRLTTQVVDCPVEGLRIGMELEAVFERHSDAVAIPKFRPAR